MELNRGLLRDATKRGLLGEQQADQLWQFLQEIPEDTPSFHITHILYLTFIGFGVIGLGLVWQRHEGTIANMLRGLLPAPMRELLERRQ
jgi:hypothetical protein